MKKLMDYLVVQVTLLKLVMRSGTLQYEKQAVNLMGRDEPGKRLNVFSFFCQDETGPLNIVLNTSVICRDGFDTLIDHAPEKLHFVKQVTHLI